MEPNIIENKINSCGELDKEAIKESYWKFFAFLVFEDIFKKKQLSLHDNQKWHRLWINIAAMSIGYGTIF